MVTIGSFYCRSVGGQSRRSKYSEILQMILRCFLSLLSYYASRLVKLNSTAKILLLTEFTFPDCHVLHKKFSLPLNAWHILGSAFFWSVTPVSPPTTLGYSLSPAGTMYGPKPEGRGGLELGCGVTVPLPVLDDWCECVPFINCSDYRHRALANRSEAVTKIAEPIADYLPTI